MGCGDARHRRSVTPRLTISNASPLIALQQIGQLELLQRLYANLAIPTAVAREVAPSVSLPSWIAEHTLTQPIAARILQADLGAGESEAIGLALEMNAHRVLLDDRPARPPSGAGAGSSRARNHRRARRRQTRGNPAGGASELGRLGRVQLLQHARSLPTCSCSGTGIVVDVTHCILLSHLLGTSPATRASRSAVARTIAATRS